jgi:hypothetical protein
MAYASGDFAKFLKSGELCKTAEQLSRALAGLESMTQLSVNLVDFGTLADRLEQTGELEGRLQSFIEGYAEKVGAAAADQAGCGPANESTKLKALIEFLSAIEQGPDRVKEQLGDIAPASLFRLVACLVTPGIGPELEDVRKVRPGDQLRSLWMEGLDLSTTAGAFGEKLGSFQAALRTSDDSKSVWNVLASREVPGLGFKNKGEKAEEAGDINPISKL